MYSRLASKDLRKAACTWVAGWPYELQQMGRRMREDVQGGEGEGGRGGGIKRGGGRGGGGGGVGGEGGGEDGHARTRRGLQNSHRGRKTGEMKDMQHKPMHFCPRAARGRPGWCTKMQGRWGGQADVFQQSTAGGTPGHGVDRALHPAESGIALHSDPFSLSVLAVAMLFQGLCGISMARMPNHAQARQGCCGTGVLHYQHPHHCLTPFCNH